MPSSDLSPTRPVDPELEAVLEGVRRRGRFLRWRRRALRVGFSTGATAAAVAVALVITSSVSTHRHTVIVGGPPTSIPSTSMPSTFVAATPDATGVPGSVDVLSSADGRVRVRLARTYTLYTENGLIRSPDGSTVYFDRLPPIGEGQVEISSVRAVGGPVTDIAAGIDPALSPDGRYLSYEPPSPSGGTAVAVRDLATGATTTIDLTALLEGYSIPVGTGLAWLGDNKLAVIADKNVGGASTCPGVVPCGTPAPAATELSRLVVINPEHTNPGSSAVTIDSPSGQNWRFVSSGPSPNSVVIYSSEQHNAAPPTGKLTQIDLTTAGHPRRTLADMPGELRPLSLNPSATQMLYQLGTAVHTATIANGGLNDIHTVPGTYVTASW